MAWQAFWRNEVTRTLALTMFYSHNLWKIMGNTNERLTLPIALTIDWKCRLHRGNQHLFLLIKIVRQSLSTKTTAKITGNRNRYYKVGIKIKSVVFGVIARKIYCADYGVSSPI